ncbi:MULTISPECIES: diguanylate cyclase domain-containing protein [unclassified Brevundimonas]|uniref:diguanylate cyclase domain-containing protein n=1 Tax=unclassified Brevundimonas TaxID=2622653 RepID=UPI000CFAD694|nr:MULTISPECIES: diguanylate cyclase [unclassified Brevundimonas]PRA33584.1 GGDEF domain-containing protein [Brevundimonas sp. MYb27]PQZ81800.1 GGDEF domain-containing protein [Brevundimonas sp. MYb31]PRB13349.1 GGDEF domain-containing protein [Brevundimonas sp. MYb52]PRB33998.1 GGDEF domain-containing protein [Brevundimonas sp. MYb46]PRB52686.1 GGDEF domain-containing protein [Brevundimonas sp. MYb33]
MDSDPRVLVVAIDDALIGPLCEGLDRLGWSTMTARTLDAAAHALQDLNVDAAVVALPGLSGQQIVARLREAASPRYLPVLMVGADIAEGHDADLMMSSPPHPAQAALRLEQLTRAGVAEEEFRLRQATFAAHGVTLKAPDTGETPLQILTAGAADRRFLAMSNALSAAGAEVVAAPTPYTAFDYLHERAFDAAVLWGGQEQAPALSIASGMKRNTRLYHIPLILYLRGAGEVELADLFRRGFADVAAAETPEDETAERVLALARNHRRRQAIRRALDSVRGSDLMDPTTGLFSRDLFASHLARLAEGARSRNRALSVCVLRVADSEPVVQSRGGGWLERAMPQIGAMVSRLVRVEDTAARLGPELFALVLPATGAAAARLAAERISAVIACTAFDAGKDRSPFVVEFDVGVAEMQEGETPAAVLERASGDLAKV